MLTLGEKKVSFRKNFLDEDNLPEWCVQRVRRSVTMPCACVLCHLSDRHPVRAWLLMSAYLAVFLVQLYARRDHCVILGCSCKCRLADYHPDGKKIPVAKDLEADKWCVLCSCLFATPRRLPALI